MNPNQRNKRYIGYIMVLLAAIFWGLSGTVAQVLFQEKGFDPGWMVTVRMIASGTILLLLGSFTSNRSVWSVWRSSRDRTEMIIFGLVGMLAVQYTYFASIQTGNAAAATLLQYLAPAMVTLYVAFQMRRLPSTREISAVILALLGTFLLVTDGSFDQLSIPGIAVFWGIASAVALAFYTLYPSRLLKEWGSILTVGWGMIVGGLGFMFLYPPWNTAGQDWSFETLLYVIFIVLFGTLIAFYLYLDSLKFITPSEASILASVEPLTAALASVLWLHISFGIFAIIGGLCIISTVIILSIRPKRNVPVKLSEEEAVS